MFFPTTPLVAVPDESIHTLNTGSIYLFKVNTEKYEIRLDTKTTPKTTNDSMLLSCQVSDWIYTL